MIRQRGKVRIGYADEHYRSSERTIWPIAIAYFETVRLIVSWCDLRENFQNFRADRITATAFLDDTYPTLTRELRRQWWAQEREHLAAKPTPPAP